MYNLEVEYMQASSKRVMMSVEENVLRKYTEPKLLATVCAMKLAMLNMYDEEQLPCLRTIVDLLDNGDELFHLHVRTGD